MTNFLISLAEPKPLFADILEDGDAPRTVDTPYTLEIGDRFLGEISPGEHADVVAVTLEAGHTYIFSLGSDFTMDDVLHDPFLILRNADFERVGSDDDGAWEGGGLDARLRFTAEVSGTYFLEATYFGHWVPHWQWDSSGSYILSVARARPDAGRPFELVEQLTTGYWTALGEDPHRFDTTLSTEITVDLDGLTTEGAQLARWALAAWQAVADIQFVEVSGGAQITFDDAADGATSGYTATDGLTEGAWVNVGLDVLAAHGSSLDSLAFQAYLQEIGHALGLGHLGNYGPTPMFSTDTEIGDELFANDSWLMSVMSAFSQSDNPNVDAEYATLLGPMMADIWAIQMLYGAPEAGSETDGNTVWGDGSALGGHLGLLMGALFDDTTPPEFTGTPVAFTLYDVGGYDTLSLLSSTTDDFIDMHSRGVSSVLGGSGNLAIASHTVLEDLLAGAGNDTIWGNHVDNYINGNGGDDVIWAGPVQVYGPQSVGPDQDTVLGGAGHDEIGGGWGDDNLWGGSGQDSLFGENDDDILGGGDGDDMLYGGAGHDALMGGLATTR